MIIDEESLLEAGFDTSRLPILILYGKPGSGYILEISPWLDGPWPTNQSLSLPDLWLKLNLPAPPFQQYLRAKRITP